MLENVRLSFPALFKPKSVQGSQPKYSASLILNKKENEDQIATLRKAVGTVMMEKWPGDKKKREGVKICVRDGEEKKETDGYGPDVIFLNASSDIKPGVVDRDKTPLEEGAPRPYAGCRVNASIRLWAMDNSFGRRINAQLLGIQFYADDDAFGDRPFDPDEEFRDLTGGKGVQTVEGTEAPDDDEIPF